MNSLALGDVCLDDHGGIENREHPRKYRPATSYQRLARDGSRHGSRVRRNAGFGRYIAGCKVFVQSGYNDALDRKR